MKTKKPDVRVTISVWVDDEEIATAEKELSPTNGTYSTDPAIEFLGVAERYLIPTALKELDGDE